MMYSWHALFAIILFDTLTCFPIFWTSASISFTLPHEVIRPTKFTQDTLVVLRIFFDETTRPLVLEIRSKGLDPQVHHLSSRKLETKQHERKGTKRRFHPVPCPAPDFQPRLQVSWLGNISRNKILIKVANNRQIEAKRNRGSGCRGCSNNTRHVWYGS